MPQPVDEIQKLREDTAKRRAQLRKKEALERAQHTNDEEKVALHRIENPLEHITFAPVWFANFSLPHSDRTPLKEMVLINGNRKLTLFSRSGLPSGVIARKFLFWVTTQALRQKNMPEDEGCYIPVKSLRAIMTDMQIKQSTGKRGTNKTLRTQMNRVLKLSYYEDEVGADDTDAFDNRHIAEKAFFKWNQKSEEDINLLEGAHIILDKNFFLEIAEHGAVPLDKRILSKLNRSPLAYDLYVWLTYRLSHNSTSTRVTFDQLYKQFATGYPDTKRGHRDFKARTQTAFVSVFQAWEEVTGDAPEARILGNGVWLRKGGKPSVPKKVTEKMIEDTARTISDEPPF